MGLRGRSDGSGTGMRELWAAEGMHMEGRKGEETDTEEGTKTCYGLRMQL